MASAAMYQAFVEIVPEAKNLRKTLAAEFDAAGTEGGKRAGKGMKTGILGSVGALAAPLAAVVAGLGIGKMFADSVNNASDLQEAGTAITAVFGPADEQIQKFARNSATALGQSTNATLDAARVFGVFGKAAGLSGDGLADFSTDFITLSADLASFNNTTPEAAIQALGAGLRGESEPLRQFGILLDDATLKARATELGIYSGTGALTQQQKVLASQAEILAQTSTQQGDFARTSGGLANQQRILSAGLTNLSTAFGSILLPVVLAVVGAMNTSLVPALFAIVDGIQGVSAILFQGDFTTAFAEAFNISEDSSIVDFLFDIREGLLSFGSFVAGLDLGSVFGSIFAAIGPGLAEVGAAFLPLIPQVLELAATFSPLGIILKAIGPLLPQLASAVGGLATTFGTLLGTVLTTLLPVISQLAAVLVGSLGQVITALLPVVTELVNIIGPILSTVITALLPIITLLAGILGQLIAAVAPLVAVVLQLIAPLLQLAGAILTPLIQLFAAILQPILGLVGVILGALIPVIQFLVTVLAAIITGIVNVITWFVNLITGSKTAQKQFEGVWKAVLSFFGGIWSGITNAVSTGIDNILGFFRSLPGKIFGFLGGLGNSLYGFGRDMIQGLLNGAASLLRNLGSFFLNVVPAFIREPFKAALGIRSPSKVFAGYGENIGEGVMVGANRTKSAIASTMKSLVTVPSATAARIDASVYGGSAAGGAPIYVQNPFTGEYLLAQVDGRARVAVGRADQASALTNRMGRQL